MKKLFITLFCFGLAAPLLADGTNVFTNATLRASYALGMLNGTQWRVQDVGFDPDIYMRGIKDALAGGPALMTEAEARQAMQQFQVEFHQRIVAKMKAQGEAFLSTNKLAPGIKLMSVPLPNGHTAELQYLILTNGIGPIPTATDQVSVNYRGSLLNGQEFDSSFKRGQPASFSVTGVIPGWTAALEKMPVGSSWKLFIPSELGYGEQGAQRAGIPPNSVLIFDVDLLAINPPPPPPPPPAPAPAPLTSDIIKVPSQEDMKNGAKIEVIKQEDVQKAQAAQQQTNK